MALKKITELPDGSAIAAGDLVPVVDVSDTSSAATGTTKQYTVLELLAGAISAASAKTTPVAADSIGIVDSEASNVAKELTLSDLVTFLQAYFPAISSSVLSAELGLGENTGLSLDAALSADGKYSGIVEAGTAGAALAFGELCYLNNEDSRWELVDANLSDGYDKKLGMCVLAAGADGNATKMLLFGKIRADGKFPTLTIGAPAYMSETAGAIVTTAPSTTDAAVRIIGFGNTADELHFSPSPDYFTRV